MSQAVIALLLLVTSARAPDPVTPAQAQAMASWVGAVQSHVPGRRDAAAGRISNLTFEQRTDLQAGMTLFLAALQGKRVGPRNPAEAQVVELAKGTTQNPGADVFLKRAAVLHADVAIQNQVDETSLEPGGVAVPPGDPPPPLLSRHRHILDKDGQILGEVVSDWNWPFARSLLDLLFPAPADHPFVSTWYHATTAFMLKRGLYAEAVPHLARAAEVLPGDPLVLFDRASYSEIQGLPVMQVLLSDEDLIALHDRREGRISSLIRTPAQGANRLNIPMANVANLDAERLFRSALRADPSLVEARVRLARLLGQRNRHDEAAAELVTALAAKPEGPVAFYAHLFAGRTAEALGKIDEAAAHYREASALFPGAQSALLAQSQAALLGADVASAVEPVHRLEQIPVTMEAREDPWWKYHLAAGRDADALIRVMWKKAAELQTPGPLR